MLRGMRLRQLQQGAEQQAQLQLKEHGMLTEVTAEQLLVSDGGYFLQTNSRVALSSHTSLATGCYQISLSSGVPHIHGWHTGQSRCCVF